MTVDEVRDYFNEIRDEQAEIEHLREMIDGKRAALLPSGIAYDKDKVQTSPDDTLAKVAADIVDLTEILKTRTRALEERRAQAEALVEKLPRSRERSVMRLYYIDSVGRRRSWDSVSYYIGMGERQVYRIHKAALENISKLTEIGA